MEELKELGEAMRDDLLNEPPLILNFEVDYDSLKRIKRDVYAGGLEDGFKGSIKVSPSTNDCLVSLIYKAFAETAIEDKEKNSENVFPFQLSVNSRFRRDPPVRREVLGNFILLAVIDLSKEEATKLTSFEIACLMRSELLKMDEQYIQSSIDKIARNEFTQFTSFYHPTTMRFTNWNRYFDWYPDTDLGQGRPEKFTTCSRMFEKYCIVKPARKEGDLDLTISLKTRHMQQFLKHDIVKAYLKLL